ncbi:MULTISPECIES: YidC/Oxa1 family membrane protein insertase [Streptomyces]|uniref:YidC/Oxa1 family membrane protein insertase n=1 Tax=Streptomyces TaxID=1883 RepID=UPI0022AA3B0A|nr:YidC/Oxa1 family membrane protein insertase [Streptomyces sp. HB2AG]MCZ2523358.1 YidC/Oxa1 family membrane protein insertase [Streptomyces sp. HB2AG]
MSFSARLLSLLTDFSETLTPLLGASATAAAVVLATAAVRLALHPLARAAARGEKARARLAPKAAAVSAAHGGDPERMRRELTALYAKEGASPLAGCLPVLVQLPVFFLMYRVFSSAEVDGRANALLRDSLLGTPLGARFADVAGTPQQAVFWVLFAVLGAVGLWSFLRARKAAAGAAGATEATGAAGTSPGRRPGRGRAGARVSGQGRPGAGAGRPVAGAPGAGAGAGLARALPWLSFGTLLTAAVVPLAAGLYLATAAVWTAAERALLHRGTAEAGARPE